MKKLTALFLSLLLLITLVGCNTTDTGSVLDGGQDYTATDTNSAQSQAQTEDVTQAPTDAVTETKPASDNISEEKAKAIALEHAGFKESEVQFLHVELDHDDGVLKYEVDFNKDNYEYDYDIDPTSGEILYYDKDLDD